METTIMGLQPHAISGLGFKAYVEDIVGEWKGKWKLREWGYIGIV